MKILLVEDDIIFSELIEEYLEYNKHTVEKAYDAEEANENLYENSYDLIIMDINIPNGDGLSILENFRHIGYKTPVIVITSFTNISLLEKSFIIGGNDFIKKPFDLKELKVRIENIEKIYNINYKGCQKIKDNIYFDFYNLNLIKYNNKVQLPKKEAEIIKYFIMNKDRIISINELVLNIWDYESEPSIATIRTYIKNIRRSIHKDFIKSIKGMGYIHTTF